MVTGVVDMVTDRNPGHDDYRRNETFEQFFRVFDLFLHETAPQPLLLNINILDSCQCPKYDIIPYKYYVLSDRFS